MKHFKHRMAMNVFYRSQMERSCPIMGLKCPLLSIINGLKDSQSSVTGPSITVPPASNIQCWCQNKEKHTTVLLYNFICQVSQLHINTSDNKSEKKDSNPWYQILQISAAAWSLMFRFRNVAAIQYSHTLTPFISTFSASDLLQWFYCILGVRKKRFLVCLFK